MAREFELIDEKLKAWIEQQKIFFVSTAPRSDTGLLNCSPKGYDAFRILSPNEVAYVDLTGSGAETIAHLKENGRICIMFCAFEGPPRIVRLQGQGQALFPGEEGFPEIAAHFPKLAGLRSIIKISAQRISDSCGYSVPYMDYVSERDTLLRWAEKKGPEGITEYQNENNSSSLDGLPSVEKR